MKDNSQYLVTTVHVDDLKQNMTILAYTGFSSRYRFITSNVCEFIKHNFDGAMALVMRKDEKLKLHVDEIEEGDSILQLYSFPTSMKKLTVVNRKLVSALKKRGIRAFKIRQAQKLDREFDDDLSDAIAQVNRMMKRPSRKKERMQVGLYHANRIVEQVKKSGKLRHEGVNILEQMMDNARMGKLSARDIEGYVDNVVKSSSSEAMTAILNLKSSDQTYTHCIDVGHLFEKIYFEGIKKLDHASAFETKNQAILGGFLHDFGKSQLPKELIDSTMRFDRNSKEMEMIRNHPHYGAKLLLGMDMPDIIINMSLCHHVKLDESLNNSYPEKLSYDDSTFESRLLAIVDVYQALVGKRNYKRSWTPPQAMRYLSALAGIEYDEQIWHIFLSLLGEYPIGSLVELSDKSQGFVMNVPDEGEDPFRPMVAVVRNEYGEDLEKQTLVDLMEEKDLSIENDLDATDVFSHQALQRFSEMKIVA